MDEQRRAALARAAERIAEWNVERGDEFQNMAMGEIVLAQDAFRDADGELPGRGSDDALDALLDLQRALDASPEAVSIACDRALGVARVLPEEALR